MVPHKAIACYERTHDTSTVASPYHALNATASHEYTHMPGEVVDAEAAHASQGKHLPQGEDCGASHSQLASRSRLEQPTLVQDASSGRLLTKLAPVQGRALLFTSGWENVHYVERVTEGVRYALPAFFRTVGPGYSDYVDGGDCCEDLATQVCAQFESSGRV